MGWIESISEAIKYIEDNLDKDITIEDIAKHVGISSYYFQKGFAMLCGFSVAEYIRKRRLSLAGNDLNRTDEKIIDIALKYGYNSPDSFTKAFIRFHGVSPTAVRKDGAMIKTFVPLQVNYLLKGGYTMNYKIIEKESFKVMGFAKKYKYDEAFKEIPLMWQEFFMSGKANKVCSKYGINIDEEMGHNEFEYMIADDYDDKKEVPEGCEVREIPTLTWAIFECIGPSEKTIQETNKKIFTEWLPNCKEYQIAAGYNIEMYSDPAEYKNGVQDEKYYTEIWIPVIKK